MKLIAVPSGNRLGNDDSFLRFDPRRLRDVFSMPRETFYSRVPNDATAILEELFLLRQTSSLLNRSLALRFLRSSLFSDTSSRGNDDLMIAAASVADDGDFLFPASVLFRAYIF